MADRRLLDALTAPGDPLSVVHALTSSSMGLPRHLTLSGTVQVALQAAAANRRPGASGIGLSNVLDLLADDAARFVLMEDAVPLDPRLPAVGRFGGQLYRLYPGMLERPLAAMRTAELVATTGISVPAIPHTQPGRFAGEDARWQLLSRCLDDAAMPLDVRMATTPTCTPAPPPPCCPPKSPP